MQCHFSHQHEIHSQQFALIKDNTWELISEYAPFDFVQ